MIRVGVVGCGGHATRSIWPALRSEGFEIVGVTARRMASAQGAAKRWAIPAAFDDLNRMIDESGPDAVAVVVPRDQYRGVLTKVLQRGIPAFVDKPAAVSSIEATALAELADRQRTSVVVGFQKRFAESYLTARRIIAEPSFGAISMASMQWTIGSFGSAPAAEWLIENPVHHFDLARFLFGDMIDVTVKVASTPDAHAVVIAARTPAGAALSLCIGTTASWVHRNEVVDVYGVGNSLTVTNLDTVVHRPLERPERVWCPNYTVPAATNTTAAVMGFAGEFAHFRDVVCDGATSLSDLRSAAATLELTERITSAVEHHAER
ncbi:hypothetical protein BH24ACT5_BH24ACT5_04910 [soil metagenome]